MVERANNRIPFQGQARPGGISLNADQVRKYWLLMKEFWQMFQKQTSPNLKSQL